MNDRMSAVQRWEQVEALFDEALTLPPHLRAGLLAQRAGNDEGLLQEVQALLDQVDTQGDVFDRPAADTVARSGPLAGLEPGTRVGAWRIAEAVGRGGMGEVYRAQRCDAAFEQQVALKLIRREAIDQLERFHEERRVLARLDHPGIAHLVDGGLADDGRPYMVMEWVEGVSIADWCRDHQADLRRRLDIFLQVCEAVAYAHRNLLVHRDLKPSNVWVTPDGRSKLLDFGIAKLLTAGGDDTKTHAPLTLAYAAPEQLAQGPITPATDVYALGLLLFELLTGQRPWHRPQMSLPTLINKQLHETAPAPSATAHGLATAPVPFKQLRGDLDAISGCALRAEPERRYRSAAELADDLRRYLDGKPVLARPESLSYSLNRFVRRNRLAAAFAGLALAALVAGLAGSLWQAREARSAAQTALREAARATATKDFLIRVFRASDPRIAQDKPRGQITAKELLDLNAPKINEEFKDDPDTQIELLGVTASIYAELGEEGPFRSLHDRQIDLARRQYGELHPAIINGLIDDAHRANERNDYVEALARLHQADPLIRRAGLDETATRARWWLIRSDVLDEDEAGEKANSAALENAVRLFETIAPTDADFVKALTRLGTRIMNTDRALAEQHFRRALAISNALPDANAAELQQLLYPELAILLEARGDYVGAEQAHERGAELARKTYGETHSSTWTSTAEYGWMLHRYGHRERAHAIFDRLMSVIPPDWTADSYDEYAREFYASCLAAEGRAAEAIPLLEAALRVYVEKPGVEYEQRRNRLILGDAYDRVGRTAEARAMIKASLDERLAKEPPKSGTVSVARERWARILIDANDVAGAEEQLREIVARTKDRNIEVGVLARADMARIALIRGEPSEALEFSRAAVEIFAQITGVHDVRTGPQVWLIRSEVLRRSGDSDGARQWAERALDASRLYDDPSAASIAQAEAAVRQAGTP